MTTATLDDLLGHCPRCDIGTIGSCMWCGMWPDEEGPAKPPTDLVGLAELMASSPGPFTWDPQLVWQR